MPPVTRRIVKAAALLALGCLPLLAFRGLQAAEFQIVDKLSVNGSALFKSSATWQGVSQPPLPPAGSGALYFDSGSGIFKISEGGAAYVGLFGGFWSRTSGVIHPATLSDRLAIGRSDLSGASLLVSTNTTATPALFVNATSGNVGIGTTSPAGILDVNGAATLRGHVLVTGSSVTVSNDTAPPVLISRNQSGANRNAILLRQSDTTDGNELALLYQTNSTGAGAVTDLEFASIKFRALVHDTATRDGQIVFSTAKGGVGFTEKMVITGAGNVGVGATAPTNKLSVAGNADLTGNLGVRTAGPGRALHVYNDNVSSQNAGILAELNQSGTPTYRFLEAKNSGGTSLPQVTFELEGTSAKAFDIWGKAGGASLASLLHARLDSGNIGIGTVAPGARLHVSSAGAIASDYLLEVSTGSSAGQEVMVVRGDGSVGLGTTNPSNGINGLPAKLVVNLKNQTNGAGLHLLDLGDAPAAISINQTGISSSFRIGRAQSAPGNRWNMHTTNDTMLYSVDGNVYDGSPQSHLFTQGTELVLMGLRKMSGQTKDILQFQDSTGLAIASVTANGSFVTGASVTASAFFGDGSGLTNVTASGSPTFSTVTVTGGAFSVGSSTLAVTGGRVGVGVTNPQRRLDVAGDVNTNSVYEIGGSTVLSVNGNQNLFAGVFAGTSTTTGSNSVILGHRAGTALTTGAQNTFVGSEAGFSHTDGNYATLLGYRAGYSNTASGNTFLGHSAGHFNTTGGNNLFVGSSAGYNNTTGHSNTIMGGPAGFKNSTGYQNTFVGFNAGYENTTGYGGTYSGAYSGANNTTGSLNTFYGYQTGYNNSTGGSNTFLGYQAGSSNTTGSDNTLVGLWAGSGNTTGVGNAFVGNLAGYQNAAGQYNSILGANAGQQNVSGSYNVMVGHKAGQLGTVSNYNTFVGAWSGYNSTGAENTMVGYSAGQGNTTGVFNTFLGNAAGSSNTTASSNTLVGYKAGEALTTGQGNVFLGFKAGASETGSNKLYIANNTGTPLIYGDFSAGAVGIGMTSPASKLHVLDGDIRISTSPSAASRGIIFQDGTVQNTAATGGTLWADRGSNRISNTNSGNVGIGTTNPAARLHINAASGTGGLLIDTIGSATNDTTQDALRIQPNTTLAANYRGLAYYPGSSNTTPAAWLAHDGSNVTMNLGGGTAALPGRTNYIASNGNTGGYVQADANVYLNILSRTTLLLGDTAGSALTIQGLHPLTWYNSGVDWNYTAYGGKSFIFRSVSGSTDTTALKVKRLASQTAPLQSWLDESDGALAHLFKDGGAYFAGNVGLSSATPTERLVLGPESASAGTRNVLRLNAGWSEPALGDVGGDRLILFRNANVKTAIGFGAANDMWFQTHGPASGPAFRWFYQTSGSEPVERMRLDVTGKLGIGATNPTGLLHVKDTTTGTSSRLLVEGPGNNSVANVADIHFKSNVDDGGSGRTILKIEHTNPAGGTPTGYLLKAFGDSASVGTATDSDEVFALKADGTAFFNGGSVGIGATAPTALLDLSKSAANAVGPEIRMHNPAGSGAEKADISFYSNGEVARTVVRSSLVSGLGEMGFFVQSGDLEALRIRGSGNVGIGTTNPASLLTVSDGDVRIATTTGSRGIVFQDGTVQTTAGGGNSNAPTQRYIRITLNGGTSGSSVIQLAELELFDAAANKWVVNNMTSANAPSPKVVSATATSYTSSAGWMVFDGQGPTCSYDNGYMSNATNPQVKIDLGSGNSIRLTKYRIWTSCYSDSGGTYRPSSWTLETSPNDSTWTTVDTRSSFIPTSGGYIEFTATTVP